MESQALESPTKSIGTGFSRTTGKDMDEKDAPEPRPIQAANLGEIVEIPEVGGLHHHYERRAA